MAASLRDRAAPPQQRAAGDGRGWDGPLGAVRGGVVCSLVWFLRLEVETLNRKEKPYSSVWKAHQDELMFEVEGSPMGSFL